MKRNALREKAALVYERLRELHPDAHCELNHSSPLELLVATILSAQCTDARVNIVTATLFAKYTKPEDYVVVAPEKLEDDIRSTGFFRNKTKSIQAVMRAVIEEHGGEIPRTLEELTVLPGIGRKTANVVLGNAFGVPGITVDTHVSRLCQRIGLSKNKTPEKIEQDLMGLYPPEDWTQLCHTIIFHGRRVCDARKPLCDDCPVADLCDFRRKPPKKTTRRKPKAK